MSRTDAGERQRVEEARRTFPGAGARRRFPGDAPGLLFAPVLWFLWFLAIYSLQGAGCAAGFDASTIRLLLGALTAVVAAAIAGVGVWSFKGWKRKRDRARDDGETGLDQSTFLEYGAALNAALFFVATVWSAVPILMADACNP